MDTGEHSAFPAAASMPGTARATLVIHWLQTLIFTASTVSFALRVLSHISHNRPLSSQVALMDLFATVLAAALTIVVVTAVVRLHRRRGSTVAVVMQWVLAVIYTLTFLVSLVGLFVTGDFISFVVTGVLGALPVTALVLLYKPATSAWFQG
ncbi:hypothetical protein [Nonomuraea endophytica]|uniref:hypothetical protein n=1 Tax=Nonomuraea endophytica TaxID=714136 RepID=UPI0037C9913A